MKEQLQHGLAVGTLANAQVAGRELRRVRNRLVAQGKIGVADAEAIGAAQRVIECLAADLYRHLYSHEYSPTSVRPDDAVYIGFPARVRSGA